MRAPYRASDPRSPVRVLAAPPVDGKANACLIAFLADRLGVARSAISLVSGDSSRAKRVHVSGLTDAAAKILLD